LYRRSDAGSEIFAEDRGATRYKYDESISTTAHESFICRIHQKNLSSPAAAAAKCGSTIGLVEFDDMGATGSVVIRNSDRSLIYPRRAIAPTGTEDVNVKDRALDDPL